MTLLMWRRRKIQTGPAKFIYFRQWLLNGSAMGNVFNNDDGTFLASRSSTPYPTLLEAKHDTLDVLGVIKRRLL